MSILNSANQSLVEQDSNYKYIEFLFTLEAVASAPVSFSYYTQDGTASSALRDYDELAGTITIPQGEQTGRIRVAVYGDLLVEGNETFKLVVIPQANATLPQGAAAMVLTGTVYDDDDSVADPTPGSGGAPQLLFGNSEGGSLPTISVRDTSAIEGDANYIYERFLVTLDRPATAAVTFTYYLVDGSASASNRDMDPVTGTVTIQPGRQSAWIQAAVYGDTQPEPNENFKLVLVNPHNAVFDGGAPALIATGTIVDNDSGGTPSAGIGGFAVPIFGAASASASVPTLSVRDVFIIEGNSNYEYARFLVTLDRPATADVTFDYMVADATASATARDFDSAYQSITISAGSQSAYISVAAYGDIEIEGNEEFKLVLSGIRNAVFAGNAPVLVATGTILDNDTQTTGSGGIGGLADLVANSDSIGGHLTARVVSTSILEGGYSDYASVYVVLSQPAASNIKMDYRTIEGSALASADFSEKTGTLEIAAGQMSGVVRVYVGADQDIEGNESFQLQFYNPIGVSFENGLAQYSSTITIYDDDDNVADTAVMGPAFILRNITPTASADTITGSFAPDSLAGLGGNDKLYGLAGNDTLDGGTGADTMIGGTGNDRYYVDNSGDRVIEAAGTAGGNDAIFFSASLGLGADAAVESLASSRKAGTVAINITGNSFAQNIGGNDGVNILNGQGGDDVIAGNGGNDRLFGGLGNDTLIGGAGNDLFFFDTRANGTANHDTIADFANASGNNDTIYINHAVYTTLATGSLGGAFAANAAGVATQADDRIIYETDTGNLFYDVNGSVAGGSTLFATLTGHPAITVSDFVIY